MTRPRPPLPRRAWALLRDLLALALLTSSAALAAEGLDPGSPRHVLQQMAELSDDDPRAARREALERAARSADPLQRFWLHLAAARASGLLEDAPAHREQVAQAQAALDGADGVTPEHRLWLEHEKLSSTIGGEEPAVLLRRLVQLRESVRPLPPGVLRCDVLALAVWMLATADSLDEAWMAAEELETCTPLTGLARYERVALSHFGRLTSQIQPVRPQPGGPADAARYFERALQTLGTQPARFRRSVLEYDFGHALARMGQPDAARPHFERALAASRAIDDAAGVAAASVELARILLEQGAPRAALPLLQQARSSLQGHDDGGARLAAAARLRILALARLKDPAVLVEIERARVWDDARAHPAARAALAVGMAEGLASQGLHAEAYAQMQRARTLEAQGRELARDAQVLHLQARYQAARREAENADLRHRSEVGRLALESQTARQRLLWAAVILLGTLSVAAGATGWRLMLRRRALADLVLKDELTGAPNRRAVTAYAQAQIRQGRELGNALTVAMIDLDHFKRVNDSFGHAAGDALLRAFAASAATVLRGQDRLGRWGGEEWMLVMPGTRLEELPRVFERLHEAFARAEVAGMPLPHGCTFSMGAATLDEEHATLELLLARADDCLYRAKDAGRSQLWVPT